MAHPFKKPSKEELKLRYGISDDDFEILTATVEPKGDLIERVGDFLGVPTFLRRSGLRIVAVIFFLPVAIHNYSDVARIERDAAQWVATPSPAWPTLPDKHENFPIYPLLPNSVTSSVVSITLSPSSTGFTSGTTNLPG